MPDEFDRGKKFFQPLTLAADNDQRQRRRIARSASPIRIDATDGRRKSVARRIEINRAGFAVVCAINTDVRAFGCRQSFVNASDLAHEFGPADLFYEIAIVFNCEMK